MANKSSGNSAGESSPQVKPRRHSVNLASLNHDYNDEHKNFFTLPSRPKTKDNRVLAKEFEERSALYSKQHSKLNLNTNIFGGQQSHGSALYSPPHQSSNSFPASCPSLHYQLCSPIREENCGDMFNATLSLNNTGANQAKTDSSFVNTQLAKSNGAGNSAVTSMANKSSGNSTGASLMNNYSQMAIYKTPGSGLDFNGLNFMNTQTAFSSSLSSHAVSFLPLNFGHPYIQSDFPNRLRSQTVLLHSLDVVGNTVNGIISVMNLTFEKKVFVKYTLNKWANEKQCEARYSKKDCDNSDKFVFQITLKETDFPPFQLNEDRTMMFAIRYEAGDRRIYWDNNYGQDYQLKCKFN